MSVRDRWCALHCRTGSRTCHLPQPYVAIAAEIFAVHVFSGSMIVAEYGIVSLVRTVRARDESESVSPFNILFLSAFFEYTFPSSTTLQYRAVTRPSHSRYGCMTSLVRQGSARPGRLSPCPCRLPWSCPAAGMQRAIRSRWCRCVWWRIRRPMLPAYIRQVLEYV